jgi:hypothetical protein
MATLGIKNATLGIIFAKKRPVRQGNSDTGKQGCEIHGGEGAEGKPVRFLPHRMNRTEWPPSYLWLHEYALTKTDAVADYKESWDAWRYFVHSKIFALLVRNRGTTSVTQ